MYFTAHHSFSCVFLWSSHDLIQGLFGLAWQSSSSSCAEAVPGMVSLKARCWGECKVPKFLRPSLKVVSGGFRAPKSKVWWVSNQHWISEVWIFVQFRFRLAVRLWLEQQRNGHPVHSPGFSDGPLDHLLQVLFAGLLQTRKAAAFQE